MSPTTLPTFPPRRGAALVRPLAVLVALAATVGAGAGVVIVTGAHSPAPITSAAATRAIPSAPAPQVTAEVAGAQGSRIPWRQPLTFSVTHGSIVSLTATGPEGAIDGVLSRHGWVSTTALVPDSRYVLRAEVQGADGQTGTIDRVASTAPAAVQLRARFAPDGGTFGVGQPLVVRFDHAILGEQARQAVLSRLRVTTTPAVEGSWRFFSSTEAHYRPATFWRPGTQVRAMATLAGLRLPGTDTWGADAATLGGFDIGRSMISVVDLDRKLMTVRLDGEVVKIMKISAGREKYPTKGGVHIVLSRHATYLFNSTTVGIPITSPDGYYQRLPYAVRISNGGAFVHAQPATVDYQGVRNVSHGCINASTEDARWFYDNSLLGDVVDVVNYVAGPDRGDPGMVDWNDG